MSDLLGNKTNILNAPSNCSYGWWPARSLAIWDPWFSHAHWKAWCHITVLLQFGMCCFPKIFLLALFFWWEVIRSRSHGNLLCFKGFFEVRLAVSSWFGGGRLFSLHIMELLPGASPDYYTFKPLESCLQSMKGTVTVVWVKRQYPSIHHHHHHHQHQHQHQRQQ